MENAALRNKEELLDHLDPNSLSPESRAALLNKRELLEGKKLLVDNFVNHIILGKNWDLLSDFIHENVEINSVTGVHGRGFDVIRESLSLWHNAFEVVKNETLHRFVDGDYVISHWRCTAKHIAPFAGIEPTHEERTFSGMNIYKVVDHKIVAVTGYSDLGR